MMLDDDACFSAMLAREPRFDGEFFIAVRTTRIYCRPSCPTPIQPKRHNVSFHRSAASAQLAGYRACKRCRPDAAVVAPSEVRGSDLIGRALRSIDDGVVDRVGVAGLATSLNVSERHLTRLLTATLGAGPIALARARRAQTARVLIETTSLAFGDVAFASGFSSIRQFNETIQTVFDSTPGALRSTPRHARERAAGGSLISVRLPYRAPFDAAGLFSFFAARAVQGVERGDSTSYARVLSLPGGPGAVELSMERDHVLMGRFDLPSLQDLGAAIGRIRRLFDLDADPCSVDAVFSADEVLQHVSARYPGRRAPGAVDGHELAVKAVLGQQVSVPAARTLAGRLVERFGEPVSSTVHGLTKCFPTSEALAEADPALFGIPRARAAALSGMCWALHDGRIDLSIGADRATARAQLQALKGIGPWTAGYVAMRALSDPDVLLADDLGVIHGARALGLPAEAKQLSERAAAWSPWRSYATQLLWAAASDASGTAAPKPPRNTKKEAHR